MTELEMLAKEHAIDCIKLRPHSEDEIIEKMASFKLGFLRARKLALTEFEFIAGYAAMNNIELGLFVERRYLSVYAMGDKLIDTDEISMIIEE